MNWLPYLDGGIGGTLKLMSDGIDRNLIEIERLQRQIIELESEAKSSLNKAEEVVIQHWSKEEIEAAKNYLESITISKTKQKRSKRVMKHN